MPSARNKTWLTYGLLAIGLALLPFLVDASLGRTWVRLLDFALLYVMLALGLNIVVGNAGLLDLGYVAFYALGAYVYAWLSSPHFGLHLPFWVVLPMGRRDGRDLRRDTRCAHFAVTRRLSRHRHARLWRNRTYFHE